SITSLHRFLVGRASYLSPTPNRESESACKGASKFFLARSYTPGTVKFLSAIPFTNCLFYRCVLLVKRKKNTLWDSVVRMPKGKNVATSGGKKNAKSY
ncbi:hypothetical protein, partial [Gottfriedia solisilvae]|uniref:hypothetical protein n=1 Tax=Gottfriedia solisilvae TaxID=1516104 RepID=UPI003D2F0A6D